MDAQIAKSGQIVPSDSAKSLSSMASMTVQSLSQQILQPYDVDAQIMLNAGGPLRRDLPTAAEFVEDEQAMRYVERYHVGMLDEEVRGDDEEEEDEAAFHLTAGQ